MSTTPHVGDTGEYLTRQTAQAANGIPAKRRWSNMRSVTTVVFGVITLVVVLGLAGRAGHRIVDLSPVGQDIVRSLWALSVAALGFSWCYDVVSPKAWAGLAAIRIGIRNLAGNINDRAAASDDMVNARLDRTDRRVDVGFEAMGARFVMMDHRLDALVTMIKEYGADQHQAGYEAALRDLSEDSGPLLATPGLRGESPSLVMHGPLRSV